MAASHPDPSARARMRHRAIAIALCLAVAVGAPAAYFAPLAVQYSEGPSAEAAFAAADKDAAGDYAYALEREYADGEGRDVYRFVSDSQPAVVLELRYNFRWFPELSTAPGAPVPSIDMPGPYYELANEDEWRETYNAWSSEQWRRRAESGGSLLDEPRREGADG